MELKYIHYLQAIAARKSISAAARVLYVSQPTLSQCLKKYEEELGYPIFSRTKQGLIPTREGQIFLDTATRMQSLERSMRNRLEDESQSISGTVVFGLSSNRAPFLLPLVLPEFHRRYPQIQVRIVEGRTRDLEHALEQGTIDLGFLIPPLRSPEISYEVFGQEELLLAVPRAYQLGELAHRKEGGLPWVALKDLADYPFLLYDTHNRLCDFIQELFLRESFSPGKSLTFHSIATISSLASAGMGVTVLPEMFAASHFQLDYYSIGPEGCCRQLSLGYPPHLYRSRPARLFARILAETLAKERESFRKQYMLQFTGLGNPDENRRQAGL